VRGCTVFDFQKNGITINGDHLVGNVHDNVVTGAGAVNFIAQNGVQIGFGASAVVSNNAITGFVYTPDPESCGVLLFEATATVVSNQVSVSDQSISILDSVATVLGNSASVGSSWGVIVSGSSAKALLEGNSLVGDSQAGLELDSGAIVDAGDCTGGNVTGLGTGSGPNGSSAGGNVLTGYGFDNAAPFAIDNENLSAEPNVLAYNNSYGAGLGNLLDDLFSDKVDDASLSRVLANQAGGLVLSCPPNLALQCLSSVPAAATDLAGLAGQGGAVSATVLNNLSSSDLIVSNSPNDRVITRHYSATDACGQMASCDQTITVDDTIAPSVTFWPPDRTTNVNAQCFISLPDITGEVLATDNCGAIHTSQLPLPGTQLGPGVYNIVVTVADDGANSVVHNTVLTVVDTNPAPLATYVDDDYTGLPTGTVVTWPYTGGSGAHYVGCDAFAAVQAGVNRVAPTGIVHVAAGLYVENVVLNKAISLLGGNVSVDPRSTCNGGPARTAESIIDGGGLDATVAILDSHVTVDGFTIRNAGFLDNNFNSGVWIYAGVQDAHVLNNIITNNDAGVSVSCSGACDIRTNLITANNIEDVAGSEAILGYANTTNLTIADNEITGHTNGNPINLQAGGADTHVGVAILRNSIHDNPGVAAVYLFGTTSGTVAQNQIAATDATCLSISGGNANLLVRNNLFSGADRGIRVENPYSVGNNSGLHIGSNSFSGFTFVAGTKYAVGNEGGLTDPILDASANWWGVNTIAGVPGIIDITGGPVDYTPWLNTGGEPVAEVCDGFQGDFSVLHVDDDSPQSGSTGRIQEGISLIADGSLTGGSRILNVHPGTYVENDIVDRAVTVLGPNAGKAGCDLTRGPEAIVTTAINDPDDGEIFDLEASYITIDGLLFDGDNTSLGGGVPVGAADVNIAEAIQNSPSYLGPFAQIDHLTIQNNRIRNSSYQGIYLEVDFNSNHSWNYIQNNCFENMWEGIQIYALQVDISNNTFTDVNRGLSHHGHNVACDVGFTPRISDNSIALGPPNTWAPGLTRNVALWVNYQRGNATALTVSNNLIDVPYAPPVGKYFMGIECLTVDGGRTVDFINNTVTGDGNCSRGFYVTTCDSSSQVTVTGGSYSGITDFGLLADTEGYQGGTSDSYVTLTNVTATVGTSGAGAAAVATNIVVKTAQITVIGNSVLTGGQNGVLVKGATAFAKIVDNSASITGNAVGVDVNAGKALVKNNNLTGNTQAGIRVENGATVDAGQCGAGVNVTGLGISTGGNVLTGYGFDNASPWAVEDLNTSGQPGVLAMNNNFGAQADVKNVLRDGRDDAGASSLVSYSQSAALYVACPPPVSVQCPGLVPAGAITLAGFVAQGGVGSSDPANVSFSDGPLTPGPFEGTITRTYTLSDACGQTNTCQQVITVDDTVPPTIICPANVTVNADPGNCFAAGVNLGSPIVGDNCGVAAVMSNAPAAFHIGNTIVVWTVTDTSGLMATCNQTVTVLDNQAPSITCPANVTVNRLDPTDPYATGFPTVGDNCTNVTVTYDDNRSGLTNCNATGIILRTWNVTDGSSNSTTCAQTITIVDTIAPLFTSSQTNITTTNDAGLCSAVVNFPTPTSIDQGFEQGFENPAWVSGSYVTTPSVDWNAFSSGIARVPSGTDGVASKDGAAHAVIDSTSVPASPFDYTGAFSRMGGYSSVFGTGFRESLDVYVDLGDAAVLANTYGWDVSSAANDQLGNHRRDFIFHAASDLAGNVLIAADNNSGFTRRNDLASGNHYTLSASGWYTLEWVFRDNAGVLAVDCNLRDTTGALLWTETRSDASDLIASVVGGNRYMWFTFLEVAKLPIDNARLERNAAVVCTPASGTPFAVGTTTVNCVSSDACGNTTTNTFSVTVNDVENPSITCPATVTQFADPAQCFATVALGTPGTGDNCAVASFTNDAPSQTVFPVGTNVVTWTVFDIHGNSNSCQQTVAIIDNQPPSIACPTNVVTVANAGVCYATTSLGSPIVNDNCAVASVTNNALSQTQFPVGVTTVTWTVVDIHGNANTCAQTVTVLDTQPPMLTAGSIASCYETTTLAEAAALAATAANDNCAVTNIVASVSGTCSATVTVTAWDSSGNTNSINYSTRIDPTAPVIGVVTATEVQLSGTINVKNGDCLTAPVVQGAVLISVVASDNCSIVGGQPSVTLANGTNLQSAAFINQSPPGTYNYSWTVTNATANGTWTATVLASDLCHNTTTNFTLCVNKTQVTGLVQLEGFVGTGTNVNHSRLVTFVATTNSTVFKTWNLTLTNVSGDPFSYVLADVPAGINGLSAKTAWTLREKLAVALDTNGQAVADFVSDGVPGWSDATDHYLRGGDFNGDNQVQFFDYSILGNNFFTFNPTPDITGDGQVDYDDYFILYLNWFQAGDLP